MKHTCTSQKQNAFAFYPVSGWWIFLKSPSPRLLLCLHHHAEITISVLFIIQTQNQTTRCVQVMGGTLTH